MPRIGMAQILVEGGEPAANLSRAVQAIERAAAAGCDAVVLPECLDFGWTDPSARTGAQPVPGPHSEMLSSAARQAGVWIVAGLVERAGERLFNAAVLIDRSGKIRLRHRKINELALAHDLYSLGSGIATADTELGRVGILICADNFPDSLEFGRAVGKLGCDLLLSPCSWAVPGDHDHDVTPYGAIWREAYSALTAEFPMTVVGVSNVGPVSGGPWTGRKCIGCSLAVGPGAKVLRNLPYGEFAEHFDVIDVASTIESKAVSQLAASRTGD